MQGLTPPDNALKPLPINRDWSRPLEEHGDPHTLYEMLSNSVDRFGRDPVLCTYVPAAGMERVPITRGEFIDLVDALASAMRSAGVAEDDRVMMIMDNCPQWMAIAYAANKLGAVFSACYTHQKTTEQAYCVRLAEPSLMIVATGDLLNRFAADKPDDLDWPSGGVVLLDQEMPSEVPDGVSVTLWGQFVSGGMAADPVTEHATDHMRLASLIFTSGTSGEPKAVMLHNWGPLSNILAMQGRYPLWPGRRTACFLPFAHSLAQVGDMHFMIHKGAEIHFISDLLKLIDECAVIQPHVMLTVPRVLNKFHGRVMEGLPASPIKKRLGAAALKSAERRIANAGVDMIAVPPSGFKDKTLDKLVFSKVRGRLGGSMDLMISGGAPLSPDVARFVQSIGISVAEGYGLSETSPLVSLNGWEDGNECRAGTVGRPIPGIEVIIDQSVWDDPDSQDGEICVRGPNIMLGYWRNEEATKEVIDPDGTFRTGDLGRLEDGFVRITGRVKEQFKLGNGKYVAPSKLEEDLKLHALVEQACVDGRGKESTYAIVQPNEDALLALASSAGANPTSGFETLCENDSVQQAVINLLRADIMEPMGWKRFEMPKTIILDPREWTVEDVLTPSMKVKRRILEKRYEDRIEAIP